VLGQAKIHQTGTRMVFWPVGADAIPQYKILASFYYMERDLAISCKSDRATIEQMIRLVLIIWVIAGFSLPACTDMGAGDVSGNIDSKYVRLPGYEHSNPSIVYLPETLEEISGIIYYPKDSSIICINDNEGVLYKFPLYTRASLQKWPFSNGEDFEEIVLHDSTFFAVQGNGNITKLIATANGFVQSIYKSQTNIKLREFEAVVYDTVNHLLLLICKDCEDDSTNITSVWGYDTGKDSMLSKPVFTIDHNSIEQVLGQAIEKFKPSAAAVHPVTGDYYLVSAINDLLVVTDRSGKVKAASVIDKVLFKQPEGLSFKPNGDMLISNEFADLGRATILLYKYEHDSLK
jgi:hypothetical protein